MTVIDKDFGMLRILKSIKEIGETFIKVGILSSADPEPDGMNMAQLATIHEYGAPSAGIPARPFLAQTITRITDQIIQFNGQEIDKIYQGKSTPLTSISKLGVFVTKEIKKEFKLGTLEPLKPATIRAKTVDGKRGTTPLIDTGRLRNSINYEVVKK